eukprot:3549339-Pleurochrysis_carterae.AAC.5
MSGGVSLWCVRTRCMRVKDSQPAVPSARLTKVQLCSTKLSPSVTPQQGVLSSLLGDPER